MKQLNVKIVIATHKKYKMPEDKMYLPIHVGAEGKKDEQGWRHGISLFIFFFLRLDNTNTIY